MAATTAWRDVPVLEAILRLTRAGRAPTPEVIADEALLHLGDVYDAIALLVSLDYVYIEARNGGDDASEIVVSLSDPLRLLLRHNILRSSGDASCRSTTGRTRRATDPDPEPAVIGVPRVVDNDFGDAL